MFHLQWCSFKKIVEDFRVRISVLFLLHEVAVTLNIEFYNNIQFLCIYLCCVHGECG